MATARLLTALLLSVAALTGCRSGDSATTSADDFRCICGTPDGAIHSCLHPLCKSGESNDENPDCACGTLSFPE